MFSSPEQNIQQLRIDPGMKVADFGSGSGFYSLAAARLTGPSGRVYAIDVQKELLEKLKNESLRQGISNIEIVWADLDQINGTKLHDKLVDRVVIANVLFQVENKDSLIKEAKRILKPTGKILFIDWTDSYGGVGPKQNDVIKPDIARVIFENHGFQFERDVEVGSHHYGFIFKIS